VWFKKVTIHFPAPTPRRVTGNCKEEGSKEPNMRERKDEPKLKFPWGWMQPGGFK